MKHALASIIIPSYNRADLIGETLDSIKLQTYTNWECIIVDDGSTDLTEKVVQGYVNNDERIYFYKRPESRPKGANACRNYGLELAKGDYINWIDSDDIMHRDKLKLQIEAIESEPYDFSVCQSLMFYRSVGDSNELRSEAITSENPSEDFVTKKIIIPIQAPVFKKQFLLTNSLSFNETLQAGQEWELFTRVLLSSENYKALHTPLDYIRRHANSISGDIKFEQKWNYVRARHSITSNYRSKLTTGMRTYLQFFYLKNLKDFLRNSHYKEAYFIWKKCLMGDGITTFKDHLLLLCSFVSFFIFKKGDKFLTKVK